MTERANYEKIINSEDRERKEKHERIKKESNKGKRELGKIRNVNKTERKEKT